METQTSPTLGFGGGPPGTRRPSPPPAPDGREGRGFQRQLQASSEAAERASDRVVEHQQDRRESFRKAEERTGRASETRAVREGRTGQGERSARRAGARADAVSIEESAADQAQSDSVAVEADADTDAAKAAGLAASAAAQSAAPVQNNIPTATGADPIALPDPASFLDGQFAPGLGVSNQTVVAAEPASKHASNGGSTGGQSAPETVTLPATANPRAETAAIKESASISASPAVGQPSAEAVERANEVLRQIRLQLSPSMRRAHIDLQPAELGRVTIDLTLRQGRLTALLRAENVQTLDLLERHTPELRSLLAQQGIETDSVRFELASGDGQNAGGDPDNPSGRSSASSSGSQFQSRLGTIEEASPETANLDAAAAFAARSRDDLGVDMYA